MGHCLSSLPVQYTKSNIKSPIEGLHFRFENRYLTLVREIVETKGKFLTIKSYTSSVTLLIKTVVYTQVR